MIYNENGIILNEEYILEDYFNGNYINSIINESFKDPKTKFGKTVKAAIDWLINKVKEFGQWLVNAPNRLQILTNKKKIKDTLFSVKSNDDNKIISIKLKGEIVKYIGSDGYKDANKWINTFNDACEELMTNPNITTDEIKAILYNKKSEDNWFVNENLKSLSSFNLNTDEIVDFSLSVSDLSKPLKQTHNNLLKFNKILEKGERINVETINAINHYFTQAMTSIRNLSYACITVCMNALKGNTSDSIEQDKYIGKDKNYKVDINGMPEEIQIQKINNNEIDFSKIKNPTDKVIIAKIKKDPKYIVNIDNPPIKAQFIAIDDDPMNIQYINNPDEEVQRKFLQKMFLNGNLEYFKAIQYIKNPSEKIQLDAVNINPYYIKYIDEPQESVVKCALEKDYTAIKFIKNPSEWAQLRAVSVDGELIKYIKNPCEKAKFKAVERSDYAINYIDNPSEDIQLAAVKSHEKAIAYINFPSEKVQLAAIQADPDAIAYIKYPYKRAIELSAKKHISNYVWYNVMPRKTKEEILNIDPSYEQRYKK